MTRRVLTAFAAVFGTWLCAAADDLDTARQALRDGFWSTARAYAQELEGDEAKLVVLQSYAAEGKWANVIGAIKGWTDADGDGFRYYHALALRELGREKDALALLVGQFADVGYRRLALRLKARLLLDAGDAAEAVRVMTAVCADGADCAMRMELADMKAAAGDRKGAADEWHAVVADTNVAGRVLAVAAMNLAEVPALQAAYARVDDVGLRRQVGFRLGTALLASEGTFAEGESLIRRQVRDAPDGVEAQKAHLRLCEAYLGASRWQAAADACREAAEMWPDAAKSSHVQQNLGWAQFKLGRKADALEAFARAEEFAMDDEMRAEAALKQGDVLNDMGKDMEAMAKYKAVLSDYAATKAAKALQRIVKLREREAEGRALYREFKFAEAQAVFAEVAKADPSRRSRMEFFAALCAYGQGMDDLAERLVATIVERSADPAIRSEAVLWLAKLDYNRGKWAEAGRLFARYAELAPESPAAPEALLWAARAAFAEGNFGLSISNVTRLASGYHKSPMRIQGFLLQGEALVELARFDEAVLVLERLLTSEEIPAEDRMKAQVMRADALFAMGADNPVRYREALESYRAVAADETLSAGDRIKMAFKEAKTLDKLRRAEEAVERYYAGVVLAYREGRIAGEHFDDEVRASFSRAAFRLADEFESRGDDARAVSVLRLVVNSDVPAAEEASRRIGRINSKGRFL